MRSGFCEGLHQGWLAIVRYGLWGIFIGGGSLLYDTVSVEDSGMGSHQEFSIITWLQEVSRIGSISIVEPIIVHPLNLWASRPETQRLTT